MKHKAILLPALGIDAARRHTRHRSRTDAGREHYARQRPFAGRQGIRTGRLSQSGSTEDRRGQAREQAVAGEGCRETSRIT